MAQPYPRLGRAVQGSIEWKVPALPHPGLGRAVLELAIEVVTVASSYHHELTLDFHNSPVIIHDFSESNLNLI